MDNNTTNEELNNIDSSNNIDKQFWGDDIEENLNEVNDIENNIDKKEGFNISEKALNDNQNINVEKKENTNIDINNNSLTNIEVIPGTINMNNIDNIDNLHINNNPQNTNNINQDINGQISNIKQDTTTSEKVNNNEFDNQIIVPSITNENGIISSNNIQNNNHSTIANSINPNVPVDSNVINNLNDQVIDNSAKNNQINPINNNINNEDEELIKAYIGEKYDKIKNSSFSLPTFFLGSLYLFYRKMYLYGWLMMLLGPLAFIGYIILAIKFKDVYIKHANKKVNSIKLKNNNLSNDELKNICSKKGGTSIGMAILNVFLLFLSLFVLMIILMVPIIISTFNKIEVKPPIIDNQNVIVNDEDNNNHGENLILLENVYISSSLCVGEKCSFSITDLNNSSDYTFSADNIELFKKLNDYKDYLKVDIYYNVIGEEKTIMEYKVFIKSTNEDISDIKTEEELRTKIGLYNLGTYTSSLTLTKIGMVGGGFKDDISYSYIKYTFVDDKNIEYEMEYRNPPATLNLVEGNKYNVSFEVVEGIFDYEFIIKEIK